MQIYKKNQPSPFGVCKKQMAIALPQLEDCAQLWKGCLKRKASYAEIIHKREK